MSYYRPPVAAKSPLITPEGYKTLQDELDYLWRVKRPEVTRSVSEAAAQGDRSENAEYIYGKNDLFAVIIIFKILLNKKAFRLMMKEIEYEIELLDGRVDTIPISKVLDRMGFPENYIEIIDK